MQPMCNVSSTEIRRRARLGESLAGLVDRRVERLIQQTILTAKPFRRPHAFL